MVNPVPGTYATDTSYRVQFSWNVKPAYRRPKGMKVTLTVLFRISTMRGPDGHPVIVWNHG